MWANLSLGRNSAETGIEMITSAEEFVRLRGSENSEEYLRAAGDQAPLAVWLDVVSRFPEMRAWVAHNRTVPLEVLEVLARDISASVRATVAEKRKLSLELFDLLSRDRDEVVRQRIAYNKKTPEHVLEHLSIDPSPLVCAAAIKRLRGDS